MTRPTALTDREALVRAIATVRQMGPADCKQIDEKLKEEPWREAAEFAAYSAQCHTLRLKPWQSPPCWIEDVEGTIAKGNDGISGNYVAALLLKRMLGHGISKYEPDPISALERTETPPMPPEPAPPPV